MDMDGARRVLDGYLDAEWAVTRAVLSEPDDGVVAALRRAAERFTAPGSGIPIAVGRAPGLPAGAVAAMAGELGDYVRRTLFKVTEHASPLWGRLFAGCAGHQKAYTAGHYALLFYVAQTEAGPRIVSVYDVDPLLPAVEWEHRSGVVVDQPGPVVSVLRLAAPERRRDHVEWAS